MAGRYAVYFSPEQGSDLDLFGKCWVGRCVETGQPIAQPSLRALSRADLHAMTTSPRHYGFHGTIVPPFPLAHPYGSEQLVEHAINFAKARRPFELEPLNVREIGNFIALVPAGQERIAKLAEDCLYSFADFREQPTLAEMERRRSKGLTPAQERLLARWGYPFVLEEYRFHLTLTDSIRDKRGRRKVLKHLSDYTTPLLRQPCAVSELCLFHQKDISSPFMLIHRLPFGS